MQALIKPLRATLVATLTALTALAPQVASAQAETERAYLVGAVGRTQYDYDCWFLASCDTARATAGKVGAGYRFGVFAVEGWWIDFGRSDNDRFGERLRLRSVGIGGAWYLRLGSSVEGLLRAGIADVRHERSGDGRRSGYSATFGLGLVFEVAPAVALELAWDVTGADGNDSGSATASALSAGLRLRF